ncbi:MAG TPA: chemotaxis protein CheA, partial [Azospirillum sp.]
TLAALEPELLHLSWTVTLLADPSVDRAAIEDVFEFVADECDIGITAEAPPPAVAEAPAPEPESEPAPGTGVTAPAAAAPPPKPAEAVKRAAGNEHAGLTSHTIRVDLDKIDRLVNMVGEMVITQAMIAEHVRELPPGEFQELLEGLEQLAQHTRELRESVMSIRAQPVSSVFSRMPRLVRELAAETGKEVSLVTSGETTEVDKTVVENLVDPLTHMIRNSIDHGLEGPDERERTGKPRHGTVHLSAQHRSGRIVIEVADDGRGINRARVLSKAIEKGLVPPGGNLSDEEIDHLIFLPGFSTADKVSNISGRGVGMDVVRRNISGLGGRIGVYSTPGEGSRFVLSLPLTLAVLDGMVISVGEERFVLPLTNIVESLRPKPADLHGLVGKCDVMMARGEYVRLVHLHQLFGIPNAVGDATRGLVVLVETEDGSRLGLVVDEVLGQQQVVIKSLEANFRRLDGVAAATILGDGRVALILDVAGLREMSRHADSSSTRPVAALPPPELEPV